MKKIQLIIFSVFVALSASASEIITAPPANGIGKQITSIYAFSSEVSAAEGAYNMLYNATDGLNSKKKWCDNLSYYPYIIYELADIYEVDKFVLRDVKPYEAEYGNVPEYWIYVTETHPSQCEWVEVAHANGVGNENTKTITLNQPAKARYVKLVVSRGIKANGDKDIAVRLFGFDVYGTFLKSVDRDVVSVGKTVLGFNGETPFYYERPGSILDGNLTSPGNKWSVKEPSSASDSVIWTVIDLEKEYSVDMFKLYDGTFLEDNMPNLKGYNVYLSTLKPDMSLIGKVEDKNICWSKVVDAYALNRSSEGVKTDEITPTKARYVKLEIPRSCSAKALNRIFQFEVYERGGADVDEAIEVDNYVTIYPNPVKRGQLVNMPAHDAIIYIYNVNGVLINNQVITVDAPTIETSMLNGGIYFIKYASDGLSTSYKLNVVE